MPARAIPASVVLALLLCAASGVGAEERPSQRVVNGLLGGGPPSVGALLRGSDAESAAAWCSGTLIGCRTFLTAAHCVCESDGEACQGGTQAPDPSRWQVFFQHSGFHGVESIQVEPSFDFPDGDLAVVTLTDPVAGIRPSPLPTSGSSGGSGLIVGFGTSGGSTEDYGLKRTGVVATSSCPPGYPDARFVCWDFEDPVGKPGEDSNTCTGDSGGPLFLAAGPNPPVVGVTSGGNAFDCLPADQSYDTAVHYWESFILGAAGTDLSSGSCGAISQVGDVTTSVHEYSGSVDAGNATGAHSFVVPTGASLLRVTMNASEENGADFDLYVKRGSPPTLSDYDCRARSFTQWGACEFMTPEEGPWHAVVNRFAGSGPYQLTATVFGGPANAPIEAQTPAQSRCIVQMNRRARAVQTRQSREGLSCLRNASRAKLQKLGAAGQVRDAQACLSNDPLGRVARAVSATQTAASGACLKRFEQLPAFGYRAPTVVTAAATDEARGLMEDLLGSDLDAAVAHLSDERDGARCQQSIVLQAGKLLDADWKSATRAKARVLAGRDLLLHAGAVRSAEELGEELLVQLARDRGGIVSRAERRLAGKGVRPCLASEAALAALFPGRCSDATTLVELASCATASAHCRFCRTLEKADGLALDCDAFDDGAANASCPDPAED